jgi:hypothetical protein
MVGSETPPDAGFTGLSPVQLIVRFQVPGREIVQSWSSAVNNRHRRPHRRPGVPRCEARMSGAELMPK